MSSNAVSVSAAASFLPNSSVSRFRSFREPRIAIATFVERGELLKSVADGGDLHFIELAGDFFAVACDERDRRALFQKLRGGGDLMNLEVQLLGDAQDVFGVG